MNFIHARNSVVLLLLVGGWLTSGRAVAAADWKKLTVDQTWTIEMPGEAKLMKQSVDTKIGKLEIVQYIMEFDDGERAFSANTTTLPAAVAEPKGAEIEKRLEGMQHGALESMKAKLVESKKISHQGFAGREYVGKLDDGQLTRQRAFVVHKTLYSLVSVNVEPKDADRFFASFKLLKEK